MLISRTPLWPTSQIKLMISIALVFLPLSSIGQPTAGAGMDFETSQMLAMLPGGKLELNTLLSIAKKNSEMYQGIQSIQHSVRAAEFRARSPFRPTLSAQLLQLDSGLEPASPFEPNRVKSTSAGVGFKQAFKTGTTLNLESRFGPTSLSFPSSPGSPGSIDFNESRFDFNLTQSLLRDGFGASSRLSYQIGFLAADVLRQQRRAELERYTLGLVNEFYLAWLAQARVQDATEMLGRRQRILRMTRIRSSRGTADRPDVLESEASSVSAELELSESNERLHESWMKLAVASKLSPDLASKVDPVTIPLTLDAIDPSLERLCRETGAKTGSAALAQSRAAQKQSEAVAAQAEIDKRPDLNVRARYSTNGIERQFNDSVREAIGANHLGWEVGLRFEMPLGQFDAEAKLSDAKSQVLRAGAQAQALADQERILWELRCKEIARRLKDLTNLRENAKRQTERGRLEEARFSIGRIRLNDVTRAEDETLIARIRLRQEEVSLRRTLWSLRELAGLIPESLEVLP